MATFGDRMRSVRRAKGMTQAELAKVVGVTQQLISLLERNACDSSGEAVSMAKALGVSPDWLSTGEGPQIPVILRIKKRELRRLKMLRSLTLEEQRFFDDMLKVAYKRKQNAQTA